MWLEAAASAATAARHASNGPWIFILDRDWWAWSGWPAVAAVGTILAAAATVGTLIFFGIQTAMLRSQAKEAARQHHADMEAVDRRRRADFRLEHTPLVSIQVKSAWRVGNQTDVVSIDFEVYADGYGPAYNVIVSFFREDAPGQLQSQPFVIPYLRPPESAGGSVVWVDEELARRTNPIEARQVIANVVFTNIFGQQTRFEHTCRLSAIRSKSYH